MDVEQNILPHCRIVLDGTEHTYEADSGADGIFSFDDIAEDVYTLTVEKDGYEDYVEEGIVIDENNKVLRTRVALKKLPKEITLIILTTPEVENAIVTLMDVTGNIVYHGKTNDEGQITFTKVHYGKYALKLKAEGYERHTSNIKVNSTNNNPRTIEIKLTPDETITSTQLEPEQEPEPETQPQPESEPEEG